MGGKEHANMSIPIPDGFIINSRIAGIVNTMGKSAGLEQNWGYNAIDKSGNECILMYCNPGNYTIIDKNSIDGIRIVNNKQISWFIGKNGYVGCRTTMNEKDTVLTLHQYLMNHYGKGRGKESIDHINRNKLDNRLSNLRITTQSEQTKNRDKVNRHKNAKVLPDEIKNTILPKFIVYYKENISNNTYREFFTVEGHPIQRMKENGIINTQTKQINARRWATTKSNRVSIIDKLESAKLYLNELDKLMNNSSYTMCNINKPEINEPRKVGIKQIISKETNMVVEQIKKEQENITNNIIINLELSKTPKKIVIEQPKQWKVKQIYEAISKNNENTYKEYCEQNNDTSKIPTWETDWASFVLSVKGQTQKDSEKIIREFVENLRRIRHNQLCHEQNSKIVDREDRQQWPAITIVRAFLDNKIDTFKSFTEEQTGDDPNNSAWQKRWESFIKSLEDNRDNEDKLKSLCSKFLTAQRVKRYRKKDK